MNVLLLGRNRPVKKGDGLTVAWTSALYKEGTNLMIETEIENRLFNYQKDITTKIIQTEDELIMKGLKNLGWIPPEDARRIRDKLRELAGEQSHYRGGWYNVDEGLRDILTGVFNDSEE